MLKVSPVTTHRIAMNRANVVVGSHHCSGETFQNDAESSRCNIKATGLEPDTIRVRHPKTLIFQIDVRNEVFAAPLTRLEAVGETAKSIDRHMSPFCVSACVITLVRLEMAVRPCTYFLSAAPGAGEDVGTGRSEFQISTITFHVPLACFLKSSTYLPRSLTGLPLTSVIVSS